MKIPPLTYLLLLATSSFASASTDYIVVEDYLSPQIKKPYKAISAVQKEGNQILLKEFLKVKSSQPPVKSVKNINVTMKKSNKNLIKEVKQSNKKILSSKSKNLIPVSMIDNSSSAIKPTNNFLYFGFGYQSLSVEDDNGYFSEYALDDSALDIKAGYGKYFKDMKIFVTGGFEYLSLEQADIKSITATINSESDLGEDVKGFIGLKTGLSYLVWDIPQDEAIESITSTSPLIGIQAGIEYQFDDGISLVSSIEYTKYFHETQIPLDTLNTNSSYGINISLKFYQ